MTGAADTFRVGISHDLRGVVKALGFARSLEPWSDEPHLEFKFLTQGAEFAPGQLADLDALALLAPRVTRRSLVGADDLAIVARFGVGLDNIDLEACSAQGVVVTITPDGVRRPTALGAIALILALSHGIVLKDQAARESGWPRRFEIVGIGVTRRVLGLVGFGNIGREIAKLASAFDMHILAHTPHLTSDIAAARGVGFASLEQILAESDFLVLACPLSPDTYHLIDASRLALMKPTAHLINVSRGAIVDESALTAALRAGHLAGAALDVFESEPLDNTAEVLALDNVIVTPHAAAYTDDLFRDCFREMVENIFRVRSGFLPLHIANPTVLGHHKLQARLERFAAARPHQSVDVA